MRKNEKAWWKAIVLLREIELEKLSILTQRAWCADDCVRGSDQSLSWFCWIAMSTWPNATWQQHIAKKRTGRVFTFWFYLYFRRQKRVMSYRTPLLTVQCAAKGPLRDVLLLLSAVSRFHGYGNFLWRRHFFGKQCKVYFFTEQFPHWPCKCRYLLCFCFNLYFFVLTETAIQIHSYTMKSKKVT